MAKILLIEHYHPLAEQLESVLVSAGHEVKMCTDMASARDRIEKVRSRNPFNIAIIDPCIPEKDGEEIEDREAGFRLSSYFKDIRSKCVGIKFIALVSSEEDGAKAVEKGISLFVFKSPNISSKLLETVEEAESSFQGRQIRRSWYVIDVALLFIIGHILASTYWHTEWLWVWSSLPFGIFIALFVPKGRAFLWEQWLYVFLGVLFFWIVVYISEVNVPDKLAVVPPKSPTPRAEVNVLDTLGLVLPKTPPPFAEIQYPQFIYPGQKNEYRIAIRNPSENSVDYELWLYEEQKNHSSQSAETALMLATSSSSHKVTVTQKKDKLTRFFRQPLEALKKPDPSISSDIKIVSSFQASTNVLSAGRLEGQQVIYLSCPFQVSKQLEHDVSCRATLIVQGAASTEPAEPTLFVMKKSSMPQFLREYGVYLKSTLFSVVSIIALLNILPTLYEHHFSRKK